MKHINPFPSDRHHIIFLRDDSENNNNSAFAPSSLPLLQDNLPAPTESRPQRTKDRTGTAPNTALHFLAFVRLSQSLNVFGDRVFLPVNIYNSVKNPGQLVMHFEVC